MVDQCSAGVHDASCTCPQHCLDGWRHCCSHHTWGNAAYALSIITRVWVVRHGKHGKHAGHIDALPGQGHWQRQSLACLPKQNLPDPRHPPRPSAPTSTTERNLKEERAMDPLLVPLIQLPTARPLMGAWCLIAHEGRCRLAGVDISVEQKHGFSWSVEGETTGWWIPARHTGHSSKRSHSSTPTWSLRKTTHLIRLRKAASIIPISNIPGVEMVILIEGNSTAAAGVGSLTHSPGPRSPRFRHAKQRWRLISSLCSLEPGEEGRRE